MQPAPLGRGQSLQIPEVSLAAHFLQCRGSSSHLIQVPVCQRRPGTMVTKLLAGTAVVEQD